MGYGWQCQWHNGTSAASTGFSGRERPVRLPCSWRHTDVEGGVGQGQWAGCVLRQPAHVAHVLEGQVDSEPGLRCGCGRQGGRRWRFCVPGSCSCPPTLLRKGVGRRASSLLQDGRPAAENCAPMPARARAAARPQPGRGAGFPPLQSSRQQRCAWHICQEGGSRKHSGVVARAPKAADRTAAYRAACRTGLTERRASCVASKCAGPCCSAVWSGAQLCVTLALPVALNSGCWCTGHPAAGGSVLTPQGWARPGKSPACAERGCLHSWQRGVQALRKTQVRRAQRIRH